MTTIVKRLAYDFSAEIKTAEEIYVAVALMNSNIFIWREITMSDQEGVAVNKQFGVR
jgi:hypothetical protein